MSPDSSQVVGTAPRQAPSRAVVATRLGLVWVIWGSTYLAIAIMIETVPPMFGMGTRFVLAALVLALLLLVFKGWRSIVVPWREIASAAGLGILMLSSGIGIVALAERYVPTGVAALLAASVPMWGTLIRAISGDRPHRLTWIGIAIGLVGIAILVKPAPEGMSRDRVVWSLILIGGQILFVIGSSFTPRLPTPRDPLLLVMYEMFFGGLAFFIWSSMFNEHFELSQVSTRSAAAVLYLTAAAIVGYGSYTWLLTHVPLSLALTYAYVNPLVAVSLGWLVLGEAVTWGLAIGGAITLIGVILVIQGERNRPVTLADADLQAVDSR